jgi:phenol hydroxylase P0 protein
MTHSDSTANAGFNSIQKFVRVSGRRSNGFIEFDFAIADPEVFVELILPEAAFEEFCSSNNVTLLEGERLEPEDSDWSWRLSQAQEQRFR